MFIFVLFEGPAKSAANAQQSSQAQSKLIQNNVEQSLANLANNLNLGSLGAYGVRPATVTQPPNPNQQFGMGGAAFGGPGMGGGTPQRQPMAAPMVGTTSRLIDWFVDCALKDWSIDWLIDWLYMSWMTEWLIDWLIDWLISNWCGFLAFSGIWWSAAAATAAAATAAAATV